MSLVVYTGTMIGEILLSKLVEKTLNASEGRLLTLVKQSIPIFASTISDKYQPLGTDELLTFYQKEDHIIVPLDGDNYLIPSSYAIKPSGNRLVSKQCVHMNIRSGLYSLPSRLDSFSKPVRKAAEKDKRLTDALNTVSLRSIYHEEGKQFVDIQRGSYFDAISTNFAMDHIPSGRSESLRNVVHGATKSLGKYQESDLANHIGVVFMIESSDGLLIAQHRSSKVANRPNSISASASGTLEWGDIQNMKTGNMLIQTVIHGAARELMYELGLNSNTKEAYFLGALRDYERGGMADFYFFLKSHKSLNEIQTLHKNNAPEKEESKSIKGFEFHSNKISDNENNRIQFQRRVRKILEKTKNQNLTFYAGTLLAAKHALNRFA